MAVLQQRTGSAPLPVFSLNAESTRIGRQTDCEILLASEDVSRYHACIIRDNGKYIIEDLQSRNGTQVNGQTIVGPVALEDGDEIQVSSQLFSFLTDDPLLFDSSPSGYTPSVISLSGATSGVPTILEPLNVSHGDRIPIGVMGLHTLNPDAIVARAVIGGPDSGWPTLRKPEEKLFKALQLQNKCRGAVSESAVLSSVMESLFDLFEKAERIAVVLRTRDGSAFEVAAAITREACDEVCISVPLVHAVMEDGESLFCVERAINDSDENESHEDLTVRYLLAAPLMDRQRTARGAVQIESTQSGGFQPLDAEYLAILSHVISCRLDDSRSSEEATGKALLNRSTQTANLLRRQLVPINPPTLAGFRIGHHVLSVPDVAGDLVDYVHLRDGRVAGFILDVPGRGPEATALMAAIAHVVNRAMTESRSAAQVIQAVEADLSERMPEVPVVTSLCVAILDPARSIVTLSIAGHCPVVHFSGGGVMILNDESLHGPPLGVPRDFPHDHEVSLNSGDSLLLCSDGVARVTDENGTAVSQAELIQLVKDPQEESALEAELARHIERIQGGMPLQDDVVLLTIQKTTGIDSDTVAPVGLADK